MLKKMVKKEEKRWRVEVGTLVLRFPNHGAKNSLWMLLLLPIIDPKFQLYLKGSLLLLPLATIITHLPLISMMMIPVLGFYLELVLICAQVNYFMQFWISYYKVYFFIFCDLWYCRMSMFLCMCVKEIL